YYETMKFRTEYQAKQSDRLLNPEEPAVLIGSCFTDNIGERMRSCRWCGYPNITGTLFNPSSIAKTIRLAAEWKKPLEIIDDSLAQRDRLWITWLSDSGCTTYSKNETKDRIFNRLLRLRERLSEAKTLIVTFGTSWIYELIERPGYVVANCHKFPSDTFVRRRLTVDEIVEEWSSLLKLLEATYPEMRIIFTVSPVRHLKDGFEGNSRSKAILQLACEELCNLNDRVEYFPSFEIMNDDLRDYRFYSSDMVHPSPEAVDYIWEKFQDRYLSKESRSLLTEGEKVTKRLKHRPIVYGDSETAQHIASIRKSEAAEYYNTFIAAHPNMLRIDE
ncbi:MAG: GSCFA domain-containing protein, partial [Muribaculaceae bacterium]|nr:GSCFA domain-containing protein [Muribaculaceae bacterium]